MSKSKKRHRLTFAYQQQSARKHVELAAECLREGPHKKVRVDTARDHLELALRALASSASATGEDT